MFIDVGIIIALSEEFDELANQVKEDWSIEDDKYYRFDKYGYRCVATLIASMNPVPCAVHTERFINRWQPKTMVLVGISGLLSEDIKIGNVVVAEQVYGYQENGKIVDEKDKNNYSIIAGGDTYHTSFQSIETINNFPNAHKEIYKKWQEKCSRKGSEILNKFINDNVDDSSLGTLTRYLKNETIRQVGDIASGTNVSESTEFKEWLIGHQRNLLAIDMESYGFLYTINTQAKQNPEQTLILRGISDNADKNKQNLEQIGKRTLRSYAMHNALQFLWCLLEAERLPKHEISSSSNGKRENLIRENLLQEDDLKAMANSLKDGRLVFFLGSGINVYTDNLNSENLPPSSIEIADYIAQKIRFDTPEDLIGLIGLPCEKCPSKLDNKPEGIEENKTCPMKNTINRLETDWETDWEKQQLKSEQNLLFAKLQLKCLSEYKLQTDGKNERIFKLLSNLLRKNQGSNPNKTQKILANIAAKISRQRENNNQQLSQPIIITTNYDDGLEKAFEQQGLQIEVVYYYIDADPDKTLRGFHHKTYPIKPISKDNSRFLCDDKKGDYPIEEKKLIKGSNFIENPIIIKLYGGIVHRAKKGGDSFVIAESHYLNFLKNAQLPDKLNNLVHSSDIVFMGNNANDTDLQALLKWLLDRWKSNPNNYEEDRGWLINQSILSLAGKRNQTNYWEHLGIKIIEESPPNSENIEDFIDKLSNYLDRHIFH